MRRWNKHAPESGVVSWNVEEGCNTGHSSPNKAVELTAYSLRYASAFGSSSPPALGRPQPIKLSLSRTSRGIYG